MVAVDLQDLNQLRSVEELAAYQTEVKSRMSELDADFDGLPFTDEASDEFARCKEAHDEIDRRVAELKGRKRAVEAAHGREQNREALSFNTTRPGVVRGDDIYDMSTLRHNGLDTPLDELRDRATRSIDASAFPSDRKLGYTQDDLRERVSGLLDRDSSDGEIAKRILLTGSPAYKRAFAKALGGKPRTRDEDEALSRAASLTTTAGGFAVPYTLDPTVILTNNGAINPVRQIANVITITGNTWNGISSAGITASYDAEAAEVSDDTPVLAQPTANVEMARAFVPMSIEVSEDWVSIQSEMARMFSDAKDVLESSKYLTGLGHTSTQPEGLLVGATGTRVTATASVFAVADLYSAENDLAPRWRSRAVWTGSKAAYQKIRQFDTGGGASLWTQLRFGDPADLLGYPAYEWSDYSSAVTTPGSSVLTFGDFNQFTIIDRVGMSVELIQHMFHTSNNLPSGQRGLFAYWRNTSDVTVSAAFKTIKIS
jgi:HK97 family phage major capsid protein